LSQFRRFLTQNFGNKMLEKYFRGCLPRKNGENTGIFSTKTLENGDIAAFLPTKFAITALDGIEKIRIGFAESGKIDEKNGDGAKL
jgi:hypothetical protein